MRIQPTDAIVQELGLQGIPTLMLFQEGKMLWRHTGFMPKVEIRRQLETALQV